MHSRSSLLVPRSAFTLVELLVVVAIISILGALLLPSLKSSRELAKRVQCLSSIRQLGMAVKVYVSDNNSYPHVSGGSPTDDVLKTMLRPFLDVIPVCPSFRLTAAGVSAYKSEINCGSYGLNKYLLQCGNPPDPLWNVRVGLPYPQDTKMPMVLETTSFGLTWAWTHQDLALNGGGYGGANPVLLYYGRNHGRGNMLNFVFVDGHAECLSVYLSSLYYPTNPDSAFAVWGQYGKCATHFQLNAAQYDAAYP